MAKKKKDVSVTKSLGLSASITDDRLKAIIAKKFEKTVIDFACDNETLDKMADKFIDQVLRDLSKDKAYMDKLRSKIVGEVDKLFQNSMRRARLQWNVEYE